MPTIESATTCELVLTLSLLPPLITIANSLDSYQDRQSVGPDLDPNGLTL